MIAKPESYKRQMKEAYERIQEISLLRKLGFNDCFQDAGEHHARYNFFVAMKELPEEQVGNDREWILEAYNHLLATKETPEKSAIVNLEGLAENELLELMKLEEKTVRYSRVH